MTAFRSYDARAAPRTLGDVVAPSSTDIPNKGMAKFTASSNELARVAGAPSFLRFETYAYKLRSVIGNALRQPAHSTNKSKAHARLRRVLVLLA